MALNCQGPLANPSPIEQLTTLREDVLRETDQSDDSDYDDGQDTSPDSATTAGAAAGNHQAFIFGYSSAEVDLTSCHPLPSHATYLWSVYQRSIDPLAKVLHIPTMELTMRDARKNPASLAPGMQALVFAVYYSAVISLEPDEVRMPPVLLISKWLCLPLFI